MDNFIINILTNPLVFFSIVILCFVIPITITIIRRKNRKIKKGVLSKKNLIIDSNVFGNLFLIYFLILFIIIGFIVIYIATTKSNIESNKIFGLIIGLIICLIPILIIINILKEYIKIQTEKYVIVLDELADKYYFSDRNRNIEDIDHSKWQLFFKDYFKKYNEYVPCRDYKLGDNYNIGDKFYLVFVKGNNVPYIYPLKEYNLDETVKCKLKPLESAKEFIKIKEFENKNENNFFQRIISKKTIIDDFNKDGHKKTAIINILLSLFALVCCLVPIFILKHILASIIALLVFLFFLFMTIEKIKYICTITKNIKYNNFKVVLDIVESLNNHVNFRDSNEITSFKFKNYKKVVFVNKKDYNKFNIGDEFYLVFVKGENAPIKVYKVKDSILSDDVKDKLI